MTKFRMRCNDYTEIPGKHMFLWVQPRVSEAASRPGKIANAFRYASARVARLENGQWTRRKSIDYASVDSFWRCLREWCDSRKGAVIWAWDVGKALTMLEAWQVLEGSEWVVSNPVLEDPPTIVTFRCDRGQVRFTDLRNWFACPWGELVELAAIGPNPAQMSGDDRASAPTLARYQSAVVEVVAEKIIRLVGDEDLGCLRGTVGAQSLQLYRHKFLQTPIDHHDRKSVLGLEKECFLGGECRAFFRGTVFDWTDKSMLAPRPKAGPQTVSADGPIYHCDVSALYPSVMRFNKFPHRFIGAADSLEVKHLARLLDTYAVCAYVCLDSPEETYPYRYSGRTNFVRGKFSTFLCGPELTRALDRGHIRSVGMASWYEKADLFSGFVDYLWAMRSRYKAAGQTTMAKMVKTLMVSLFGKFAQKTPKWEDIKGVDAPTCLGKWLGVDYQTGQTVTYRAIGRCVQEARERVWSPHAFPAIAAYVTSYGREQLRALRSVAGDRNYYYQDTDSLHLNRLGFNRLTSAGFIRQDELGYLRLEAIYSEVTYRGLRNYTADGRDVIAGLPEDHEEIAGKRFRIRTGEKLESVINRPADGRYYSQEGTADFGDAPGCGVQLEDGWVDPYYLGEVSRGSLADG